MPRPARALPFTPLFFLPILVTAALFVAGLRLGPDGGAPFPRSALPHEPFDPQRCTWSCHNHGCAHTPKLPAWLASDAGLFGRTIHGLHRIGRVLVPKNPNQGYGLANLILFCIAWPGLMWVLYGLALRQRLRLRERRRAADPAARPA